MAELLAEVPRRALAIYAHPDDPDVSCGGTLAAWSAAGCEVHTLICTDGGKGTADPGRDPSAWRGRVRGRPCPCPVGTDQGWTSQRAADRRPGSRRTTHQGVGVRVDGEGPTRRLAPQLRHGQPPGRLGAVVLVKRPTSRRKSSTPSNPL